MSVITDWRVRDEELPDLLPGEKVERVIAPQKFVVLHQIILRGPYLLRLRIGAVRDVPFELVNVDGEDRRYRPKDLDQESIKSQLVATGAPALGPNAIALPPGIDVCLELRNERGIPTKPHASLLVQEEVS